MLTDVLSGQSTSRASPGAGDSRLEATIKRLAEFTEKNTDLVDDANERWVISFGSDLINQEGHNQSAAAWSIIWPSICESLGSMARQFGHQRHHIVFGGIPEMWDIPEPDVFTNRCAQVMREGRRLGLHMVDGGAWVQLTTKADWKGYHLRDPSMCRS